MQSISEKYVANLENKKFPQAAINYAKYKRILKNKLLY